MIQAEELYQILHRKPFQPFRVCLKDGPVYDIRYQHLGIVGETFIVIGIPATDPPDDPWPLSDYLVILDLTDIDRVEPLPAAVSPLSD